MALSGADLLIYPTAIGWDLSDSTEERERQLDAWTTVQRGHSIANSLPLLAVNRVGFEASSENQKSGIKFWGSSFVAGPQGEILAQASRDNEEIILVDIDMAGSERVRRIWPFLRDRRIDAYGDLLKRFRDN
jgi:N-carbamoylputrescine amidase